MRAILVSGLGGLVLAACQGANNCIKAEPRAVQAEAPAISVYAARSIALDEVYSRHPSRALVDFANVEQTATGPAIYMVHVEMTGSPEARAIHDVEISETARGDLAVTGFTKAQ